MNNNPPHCEHWILGDIVVEEKAGLTHRYQRAILVTFKTVEEYREALKFIDPLFSTDEQVPQ